MFWEKHNLEFMTTEEKNVLRVKKTKSQKNSTESNEMNPIGVHGPAIDENMRAIPGGRYGCAQFVKS